MLEQGPAGGQETETAIGRFLNAHDQALAEMQEELAGMVQECHEENEFLRSMYREPLESVCKTIAQIIEHHEGLVLVRGLSQQLDRLGEYSLSGFEGGKIGDFAIPTNRISGIRVLSGWYGNGHDVNPKGWLRIETKIGDGHVRLPYYKPNQFGASYTNSLPEPELEGRWHKIRLGQGLIRLVAPTSR